MTTLIYRGVRHNGICTVQPRIARKLIYRGVCHDGLSKEQVKRISPCAMVYLGIRYTLDFAGTQT
ncbi:MAG: hypothetical protein ABR578_07955 [Chromatocurvus sp.]|nr:hypothetical protein [Halomonas sp.]